MSLPPQSGPSGGAQPHVAASNDGAAVERKGGEKRPKKDRPGQRRDRWIAKKSDTGADNANANANANATPSNNSSSEPVAQPPAPSDGGGGGSGSGKPRPDRRRKERSERRPRDSGGDRNRGKAETDEERKAREEAARRAKEEEAARKLQEEQRKQREAEERAKQELAEQQRKEAEEKARQEEEARRKAEEEKKAAEEARRAAQEAVEEDKRVWEATMLLRKQNAARRASSSQAANNKLDSTMKKIQSHIKKLKLLGEQNVTALCGEMEKLNLRLYVSEVVDALLEAKLARPADITACVQLASQMHSRYVEFTEMFIPKLLSEFEEQLSNRKPARPVDHSKDKDKDAAKEREEEAARALARKRSTLRLLTELFFVGVFSDHDTLMSIVKYYIVHERGDDPQHQGLTLVTSFMRYGGEIFCGIVPRSLRTKLELLQLPMPARDELVPPARRQAFATLVRDYFNKMGQGMQSLWLKLKKQEKKNRNQALKRGDVPERDSQRESLMRESFEKLDRTLRTLADYLDTDVPALPTPEDDSDDEAKMILDEGPEGAQAENLSLFDDEPTRIFYEDLPDLRLVVPAVLLMGEAHAKEKAKERRAKEEATAAEAEKAEDNKGEEKLEVDDAKLKKMVVGEADEQVDGTLSLEDLERVAGLVRDAGGRERILESIEADMAEDDGGASKNLPAGERKVHAVEALVARLNDAFNRENVDAVAEKFCYHNSKANRKRLVHTLYYLDRSQWKLIPYYARLIATLSRVLEDIGTDMVALLRSEFFRLLRQKEQGHLEIKMRNIRYLSELTKFGVCNPTVIFSCWQACLLDWKPHSIQVMCTLLETCGRWLYRSKATHYRCAKLLERTTLLKESKYLEPSLLLMLDNAYFAVKPPLQPAIQPPKARPPLHMYIRKLLFYELSPATVSNVLTRLRKLQWTDETTAYVLKCLFNVTQVRFDVVDQLACVACGLAKYHTIGVALVDWVLEEIRYLMDLNDFHLHQRHLTYIKYLGELYNYRMVDSQVIFDSLYLFITLGQGMTDRPTDAFRARMVCTLLDACGEYFDTGSLRKRLDQFLIHFQRYLLQKETMPIDVEYMVFEMFDKLRPKMTKYKTLSDVMTKITELEADPSPALARDRLLTQQQIKAMLEAARATGGLGTITEDEQAGDDNAATDRSQPKPEPPTTPTVAPKPTPKDPASKDEDAEADGDGDEDEDEEDEDEEDDADAEAAEKEADEAAPETKDGGAEDEDEDEEDEDDDTKEQEVTVSRGRSKEDDDFMKDYERMVQSDIEARKLEATRSGNLAPASAVSLSAGMGGGGGIQIRKAAAEDRAEDHMVFKLITRGKNKPQARDLLVPLSTDLAANTLEEKRAAEQEQRELKKAVIQALERESREDELRNSVWFRRQRGEQDIDVDFSHRGTLYDSRNEHETQRFDDQLREFQRATERPARGRGRGTAPAPAQATRGRGSASARGGRGRGS